MDREYKEIFYGSMFDELDRVQANKLYTNEELQKEALNVGGIAQGIKGGAKSLAKSPSQFMSNVQRAYGAKAPAGAAGIIPRIKNVLKTDEGKLLAAGTVGLGVAGGLAMGRRPNTQVVVNR
jgi:hypothetical protein